MFFSIHHDSSDNFGYFSDERHFIFSPLIVSSVFHRLLLISVICSTSSQTSQEGILNFPVSYRQTCSLEIFKRSANSSCVSPRCFLTIFKFPLKMCIVLPFSALLYDSFCHHHNTGIVPILCFDKYVSLCSLFFMRFQ